MLIPAQGKILVEVYSQKHPLIHLPESVTLPKSSIAEIINGNSSFPKGQLVLVPTKAGLIIKENGVKQRLINESDVIAIIVE